MVEREFDGAGFCAVEQAVVAGDAGFAVAFEGEGYGCGGVVFFVWGKKSVEPGDADIDALCCVGDAAAADSECGFCPVVEGAAFDGAVDYVARFDFVVGCDA